MLPQTSLKVEEGGKSGIGVRQRRGDASLLAEEVEKASTSQGMQWLPEAERGKEVDSPLVPPVGRPSRNTFILAQESQFEYSDLHNYEKIILCCLNHQVCGNTAIGNWCIMSRKQDPARFYSESENDKATVHHSGWFWGIWVKSIRKLFCWMQFSQYGWSYGQSKFFKRGKNMFA